MIKRPNKPQESCFDTIYRFQGVLFIISVPLLLICLVLFVMPRTPSNTLEEYSFKNRKASPNYRNGNPSISSSAALSSLTYAVIFDAGSSGSRVHVFCFDQHLDLVPVGKNLELFLQTKPGLSAYSDNPPKAAESLLPLLSSAENSVPLELRSITSVRVGATAGLRALEGDASDRILQEVRDLLKYKSTLRSKSESVIVLDGTQEGSFQWVTINYLLGNLGKKYSDTVGVVDLGGGSVQMAYAISEADASSSPKKLDGENSYVKEMHLNQSTYYLYVHSYLHYGLLAARAEVLKVSQEAGNPCIMGGYHGMYSYGGLSHDASASPFGASLNKCKAIVLQVLNGNTSACVHMKCTFGGIWNGGGGDGQKNLFVASFFFDKAVEANFVDSNLSTAKVHPLDFEDAAKRACETKMEDAKSAYPKTDEDNLPYLCMDLTYQLVLLVDGFGLDLWQEITLVKRVKYHDWEIEAAWPLGSAIDMVSETKLP